MVKCDVTVTFISLLLFSDELTVSITSSQKSLSSLLGGYTKEVEIFDPSGIISVPCR